jgi:hypothetical protein
VSETINRLKVSNLCGPRRIPKAVNATLEGIVATIKRSFEKCSIEFEASGVRSWMDREISSEEGSIVVYFGADFANEIEALLDDTGLDEQVLDGRLYGWIEFETPSEGRFQIAGISGKRLFADLSYMPDDVFDRQINELDESTKRFLHKVGRGLAIGAAIGALERIEETRNELVDENSQARLADVE